jgi:hypothetical protein
MNTVKNKIKTLTEAFNYKSIKSENGEINSIREFLFRNNFTNHITHCRTRNNGCECDQLIKDSIKKFDEHNIFPKEINQAGGRNKSYDFSIIDIKNIEYKVELKVNNIKTKRPPQLCDIYLSSSNTIIENQYINFLESWKEYLEKLKKEFNLISNMPTIKELENNICLTGNSACTLLNEIKNKKRDLKFKQQLEEYAKECSNNFITNNFIKVNKENVKKIIENKLNCKDIILKYNQTDKKIYLERCTKYNINIIDIKYSTDKKKRNNGYIIKFNNNTEEFNIKIIFNWKNNIGIYGPYFKFTWPKKI